MSTIHDIQPSERLLLQWSDVAPNELRKRGSIYQIRRKLHPKAPAVWTTLNTSRLLQEVIQAIAARGWVWKIYSDFINSRLIYFANISEDPYCEHEAPSHALLAAYVHALGDTLYRIK